jgi:acyl-CoA thioester hydrolase
MSRGLLVHRHRVRYHETDAQRVVYNARYLEYVDVAMTELFRTLGWEYGQLIASGCDPSLAKAVLEFRRPAVFDDELDIYARPTAVGTSSFTLEFEIRAHAGGALIAAAEIVYVNVDIDSNRSRPLPADVRAQLQSHEQENTADGH